jgi:hypothetical protein
VAVLEALRAAGDFSMSVTDTFTKQFHAGRIGSRVAGGVLAVVVSFVASQAMAMAVPAAGVAWKIAALAQPTNLSVTSEGPGETVDQYVVVLTNTGSEASRDPVRLTLTLPVGITVAGGLAGVNWACATSGSRGVLTCSYEETVAPLEKTTVLTIPVDVAGTDLHAMLTAAVVGSGGGAPVTTASVSTVVGAEPPAFGFLDFSSQTTGVSGAPDTQADDHPLALTTAFDFPQKEIVEGTGERLVTAPVQFPKSMEILLPAGLTGSPQAAPRCTIVEVDGRTCPASRRVGTLFVNLALGLFSGDTAIPIYNVIPERGYPAEFGAFIEGAEKPAFMYVTVRTGPEYGLDVSIPDIPRAAELTNVAATFFGDPGELDETGKSPIALLTNPSSCSGTPLVTRAIVHTWDEPHRSPPVEAKAEAPPVAGCDLLQFQPTISVLPESDLADEPSGYAIDVQVPQNPSGVEGLTTPDVKSATVTLPQGVSLSPAAADGLAACPAEGPEGINITGPLSEEEGPNGEMRATAGHCPQASQVGTVEASTPALPQPLQGHVYVAAPGCGGAGQAPCGETDAVDGNLYGLYMQLEGSGVIIKLHGTASANPKTGQLTASFRETPQQPVSDLKVVLTGGPRAPLANPQSCGEALTTSDVTPWSTPETPDANPGFAFPVVGCESSPFAPSFLAGTTDTNAGAYTEFSMTLGRSDRMQDLGGLQLKTPPGLLGTLAHVALCEEPQAAQGTCSSASAIGTATVGVGAGSHPFWVTGKVYATGPYNGAPFGLSIVLPAVAGPFNLGTVVERAALNVDPTTAALTVTSGPIRQILDGIPLRVQTINVTVNRPQFMFNPTNCAAQRITATVSSAQGSTAQVSSPFAAGGCKNLPFDPGFKVSTRVAKAKGNGAELDVKVSSAPGQANVHSVSVAFPKQMPARLKTIQKSCLDTTFDTNPAACPPQSLIGVAKAISPVLTVPLVGPAYLVSHGGAAFPDVDFVLQGEGVRIDLTGSINISKQGITSSTFANVPDAPLSSFEVQLPEGPYSALTNNGSLCAKSLTMPTTIVGQNGRRLVRSTKIAVAGCPKKKPAAKRRTTANSSSRSERSRAVSVESRR